MGVLFEVVVLGGNAQFLEALKLGQADFASNNATLARAKEMNFAQAHLEIEAEFLVPPDSSISITNQWLKRIVPGFESVLFREAPRKRGFY